MLFVAECPTCGCVCQSRDTENNPFPHAPPYNAKPGRLTCTNRDEACEGRVTGPTDQFERVAMAHHQSWDPEWDGTLYNNFCADARHADRTPQHLLAPQTEVSDSECPVRGCSGEISVGSKRHGAYDLRTFPCSACSFEYPEYIQRER
jgi:hypothetical protein